MIASRKETDIGQRSKKEGDRSDALGSVAEGEDGLPSKSSLVTMNGPNESHGPIKDYSRRRSASTGLALASVPDLRRKKSTSKMLEEGRQEGRQIRFLHACLTFAGSHLIGTSKYTFRSTFCLFPRDYIELEAPLSRLRDNFEQSGAPRCKIFKAVSVYNLFIVKITFSFYSRFSFRMKLGKRIKID